MPKYIKNRYAKVPCKVEGCKFYGKPIYFIQKHMLRHKEKGDVGNIHQQCTIQGAMAASHDGKRGRRAGICDYPSCQRRGSMYVCLTRQSCLFSPACHRAYGHTWFSWLVNLHCTHSANAYNTDIEFRKRMSRYPASMRWEIPDHHRKDKFFWKLLF